MEVVLKHISMIPGVTGCFMCNKDGIPLAKAFPPTFDPAVLKRSAEILLPKIADGLQKQTDGSKLVDLRLDVGRIIVKQISNGFLALLCTDTVDLQVLTISLNIARNRINNLMLSRQSQPPIQDSEPRAFIRAEQPTLTPMSDHRLRKDGKGVILTIDSMNVSSKIRWNQMEEVIAISKKLTLEIQSMFNVGPFKKMKLANKSAGCSKTFSVITFERDNDQLFDDKIVLTLASTESMKTKPGDEITAEPVTGGGFFG